MRGADVSTLRYRAAGRRDTATLAESLVPHLRPGDVVLLIGTLGSGKTSFVQDVAAALGATDAPTSPTFTLANFHQGANLTLLHVDTYRLQDLREFRDLGLEDFMDDCVTVVEWGELVAGEFPEHLRVQIDLPADGDARDFELSSGSPRWTPVIEQLRQDHLRTVS
jgi:tRNA threonylcarbamoyladenosine biosynthesis protein TsaE